MVRASLGDVAEVARILPPPILSGFRGAQFYYFELKLKER